MIFGFNLRLKSIVLFHIITHNVAIFSDRTHPDRSEPQSWKVIPELSSAGFFFLFELQKSSVSDSSEVFKVPRKEDAASCLHWVSHLVDL